MPVTCRPVLAWTDQSDHRLQRAASLPMRRILYESSVRAQQEQQGEMIGRVHVIVTPLRETKNVDYRRDRVGRIAAHNSRGYSPGNQLEMTRRLHPVSSHIL